MDRRMGIVDRIEGEIVVLEIDGAYENFEKDMFPLNLKEGDVVEFSNCSFIILEEETKKVTKKIEGLFKSLFNEDY